MSYKISVGSQVIGDLKSADDAQRDTLIDFGEDQIDFQTSGTVRLQVNNNGVYIPDSPTNASLFVSGGIQLTPGNQEGIRFTNKGNTALNFISFQEGSEASSQDARLGYNSEEYIFISPGRSGDFFINSAESSGDYTYPFSIMDDGTAKFMKGLTSVTDRALDLDSSIAFYVSGTTDGNNNAVFAGDVHISGSIVVGGSYSFPTADGNANEVLTTDGAGTVSFQSISNLNVPSFIVFGESSSKANQTSLSELKTTNGVQNGQGWRMPVAGAATHISIQFDSESYGGTSKNLVVELFKNGVSTAKTISVAVNDNGDFGGNGSITSESFSAGDRLTLKFQHSDTGITTSKHAAILRILTSTA